MHILQAKFPSASESFSSSTLSSPVFHYRLLIAVDAFEFYRLNELGIMVPLRALGFPFTRSRRIRVPYPRKT